MISDETLPHPFHGLLEELRRRGFNISTDDHIRLMRILVDGQTQFGPEQLKFRLCPLLARTAEEQHVFYQVFDTHFPAFATKPLTALMREPRLGVSYKGHQPLYILIALFAVFLAIAIALSVILGRQAGQQQNLPPPSSELRTPQNRIQQPYNLPTDAEILAWVRSVTRYLLLWVFFSLSLRTLLVLRRVHLKGRGDSFSPPGAWPLSVPNADAPEFIIHMARRSARPLKRRIVSPSDLLDLERTIKSTIESLGFLQPTFVKGGRVAEYVVLIETVSSADHLSRLYKELSDCLRAEGLSVTCYLFIASSPQCTVLEKGEALEVEAIRKRHYDARLIVVSEGEFLIDKDKGELSARATAFRQWHRCVVLTPKLEAEWSESERFLRREFPLFEASREGLRGVADFFTRDSGYQHSTRSPGVLQKHRSPLQSPNPAIAEIQSLLGPRLFRICCACALYPSLQWELTLAIIRMLDPALLEDPATILLFRLGWYRTGTIPAQTQSSLVQQLNAGDRKRVRSALINYLQRTFPPANSLASKRSTIEMAVQTWDLDPADREYIRERPGLWLSIQRISQAGILSQIPRNIRKKTFIAGLPALGLKTSASWWLAVPCVVLASRFVPLWAAMVAASASTLAVLFNRTREILVRRRLQESVATPLWSLSHEMIGAMTRTQSSAVTAIAILPGGRAVISGGYDGSLILWQATTGEVIGRHHAADKAISSIATSFRQRAVIVGSREGQIQVWTIATKVDRISYKPEVINRWWSTGVTAISIGSNGGVVAAASEDGNVSIWSSLTGRRINEFQYGPGVRSLAFSRDMKTLFIGGYDGFIMTKSIGDDGLSQFVDFRAGRISSLVVSEDGNLIAAGTFSGFICIWQVSSKKQQLAFRGHEASVSAIRFQADSEAIVSASVDGTVKGWNTVTGQELFRLSHSAPVTAMDLDDFNKLLCTGCTDGTIRIWELSDGLPAIPMESVLGWSKTRASRV